MIGKRIVFIDRGCDVSSLPIDMEIVKARTSDPVSELNTVLNAARRGDGLTG